MKNSAGIIPIGSTFDLPKKKIIEIKGFCEVFPMPRPRISRSGTVYQPRTDNDLIEELTLYPALNLKQNLWVDSVFYYAKPLDKIGDIDNITKTLFDALVKTRIIHDDKLVIGSRSIKKIDSEPWFETHIYEVTHGISITSISE